MRKFIAVLFLVILGTPLTMHAGLYGILKGKVVDDEGKGVVGASVLVEGTSRGTYVKDKNGSYTITNIPSGVYQIKFRSVGKTEVTKEARISADQTTELNVTLTEKSSRTGEIEVIANKDLIRKDQQGSQSVLSGKELQNVAREGVLNVVSISAGVQSSGGGFYVRGSRSTETQVRVDGLDVSNQITGTLGLGGNGYYPMVSQFATEEVQVKTGGFSAEYGEATGGVVNTVVKTGKDNMYEGLLRWRGELEALYGSQSSGVEIVDEGTRLRAVSAGEGAKLQGAGENQIDAQFSGPIPFLSKSTFSISGVTKFDKYSGGYEIYDPLGNNLGHLPGNDTWMRNITGRMSFGISENLNLLVGGTWGLTTAQGNGWAWLYQNDKGILPNGAQTQMTEAQAKQIVGNQFVNNVMTRINHTLSSTSFYDLTLSYNQNDDIYGRRMNVNPLGFFSGYDIYEPVDELIYDGKGLVKGRNENGKIIGDKIIDIYQSATTLAKTEDGFLELDMPTRNPITGFYEGGSYFQGTDNPYGIQGSFYSGGNNSGFDYRLSTYWQADGSYTSVFNTSDFNHVFKTGFEVKLYTLNRYQVGNPWDGNPFYDVYTDQYGGNIYADNQTVWDKTSKPFEPRKYGLYFQDQIAYKGIIISPSIRFDLFDPNAQYRTSDSTFTSIRADSGFAPASMKFQISPRINIAYPVTDQTRLNLAYGIYYKMPQLSSLYDKFAVDLLRTGDILGNPNLGPQRTNQYQVSLEQIIGEDMLFTATAYYKDIYNELGVTYVDAVPNPFYISSVNEYGNSRGIEFEFRKRPTDHIGLNINYTISQFEGTAPDATSNYGSPTDVYSGKQAFPLEPFPQPWDSRHNVKMMLDFVWNQNEGPAIGGIQFLENMNINFTGTYRSGFPYTKTDKNGNRLSEINAERQPSFWRLDSRITKLFYMSDWFGESMGRSSLEFFADIINVTNRTAIVGFFSATGDPLDNGSSLARQIGSFNATPWYKEATYANPESYRPDQYDMYGRRLYNEAADFNHNGVVEQSEKYQSYLEVIKTSIRNRGNFQAPRTVAIGATFRF
ncbi:MAG: TonB-dependent receptor [Chloroflexota bacterium]